MGFFRPRWWIAGAALAALLLFGLRYEHHLLRRHLLHPGDRLTPIALLSVGGQGVTVAPAGRAQIINVFATWCPPCRGEMPAFAAVALRLQRHGIDVVGIDQQEGAAQVSRFAREFSLSYPVFIDRDGITHDVLGAHVIPTTIYVDARGIIRWERNGPLTRQDLIDLADLTGSPG